MGKNYIFFTKYVYWYRGCLKGGKPLRQPAMKWGTDSDSMASWREQWWKYLEVCTRLSLPLGPDAERTISEKGV